MNNSTFELISEVNLTDGWNATDYGYYDPCSQWIQEYNESGKPYPNSSEDHAGLELELLHACVGAQSFGDHILWPLTVVYIVMGITGTFGNVLVCHVIVRNISMRTSTNLFLFSLAVADIAILLMGATFDLSLYWRQYPWVLGETLCKLRAFLSEMTSYCSVLTILAFSCERYLAICHPLYSYTMAGVGRTARIIVLLWMASALAAAPFYHFTRINYWDDPFHGRPVLQSAFCAIRDTPDLLFEGSFLFFFLLPLLALLVLYFRMGVAIKSNAGVRTNQSMMMTDRALETVREEEGRELTRVANGEAEPGRRAGGPPVQGRSRKAVLKMLAAVVFSFFLCWAPFHTQRLLVVMDQKYPHIFSGNEDIFLAVNEKLYYINGIFYYLSSTINPVIYNLMSAKYRRAFLITIANCCGRKATSPFQASVGGQQGRQSTMVTGATRERTGHYLSVSPTMLASKRGSGVSAVSFCLSQARQPSNAGMEQGAQG